MRWLRAAPVPPQVIQGPQVSEQRGIGLGLLRSAHNHGDLGADGEDSEDEDMDEGEEEETQEAGHNMGEEERGGGGIPRLGRCAGKFINLPEIGLVLFFA